MAEETHVAARNDLRALRLSSNVDAEWWAPARRRLTDVRRPVARERSPPTREGRWEPVIGPGRVFDPEKVRLLCFNNLGSCYGSSGPVDEGFPLRVDDRRFEPPAPPPKGDPRLNEEQLPATVTPWDQARAILQALLRRALALPPGGAGGGAVTAEGVLANVLQVARASTGGAPARRA
jgi:hypothetical protein